MSGGKRRSVAAALTLSSMANGRGSVARVPGGQGRRGHGVDASAGRRLAAEASDEGVEAAGVARRLDLHPAGRVAHPAGEAELGRQAPDERPEADALDDAFDHDAASSEGGPGGGDAHARLHGCRHANRLPPPSAAGWAERPVDGIRGAFVTLDSGRAPASGARSTQERGPPGPLPQHPEATR